MRKKKHGAERIAACAELLIETPSERIADPTAFFPDPGKPLCLEIGCGKGDFAVGMAKKHPDVNFIAMEKFADAACLALEKAKASAGERPADNLRFLIGDAKNLADWFPDGVFDCIYLNFSDPWPKKGHAKRRLTYRGFLALYRRLLKADGRLEFKTDNRGLFDFSLAELAAVGTETLFLSYDLHRSTLAGENIETEYERNFSAKGFDICAVHVRFLPEHREMPMAELLRKNRSYRSFDPSVLVTREQLLLFLDSARFAASSVNLQPLRYRPVTGAEERANLLPLLRFAGKLKEIHLPPAGHEPAAYVVICSDETLVPGAHAYQRDVGIAAEAILLCATEYGLGGCMIGAFDAEGVKKLFGLGDGITPELVLAIGKPDETVELVEGLPEGATDYSYYRENGIHYVPKRRPDDVLLP